MTLDTLIMSGGVFVAVLPFLGIPQSIDTVLLFVAGVFLLGLGIAVRRRLGTSLRKGGDTFVDSTSHAE